MVHGRHALGIAPLRHWSRIAILGATMAGGNGAMARADEACLSTPTPACIVDFYAAGADLPLHAVRFLPTAELAVTRVFTALLALDEIDIAEAVARRELAASGGARLQDRASPIAVARLLASVRAGAPDFSWLDGVGDPDGPLAALYGSSTAVSGHAGRAWFAYWQAGNALLAGLAEQHGVATIEAVPLAMRGAFRLTPVWQGLDAGLARWTEAAIRHSPRWDVLADFRARLGDTSGAREALERFGTTPVTGMEIRLWWRLGDPGRAETRVREGGDATLTAVRFDLAVEAALAAGDHAQALRLIADAWPRALTPRRYNGADMNHARRLVRATAAAGARADAIDRAETLRGLVRSVGSRENETYWIEAGAALNDIGEHGAALVLLHEELGWWPEPRAAHCATRSDRPAPSSGAVCGTRMRWPWNSFGPAPGNRRSACSARCHSNPGWRCGAGRSNGLRRSSCSISAFRRKRHGASFNGKPCRVT